MRSRTWTSKLPFVAVCICAFSASPPLAVGEQRRVLIEPGVTFEQPEGWALVPGLLLKSAVESTATNAVQGTSLEELVAEDFRRAEILLAVAKAPIGTPGNFVVYFEKVDLADSSAAIAEMTLEEVLDTVLRIAVAQLEGMPGQADVLRGPEALKIKDREWRALKWKGARTLPQQKQAKIVETYYTQLGKGLLRVSGIADEEIFPSYEPVLKTIVGSITFE